MATGIHDPRYRRLMSLLKNAREGAGLSQQDVATRLGRLQQFVSKYESGERRLDVIEFAEVAHVLGLSVSESLRAAGVTTG